MLRISAEFEIRKRYALGEKNFQGTLLRKTELTGINLSGADLRGADLSSANLRYANLSKCNLTECCLNQADLTEANLTGANLTGASLLKSTMNGANLTGANLTKGFLTGALLANANLKGACLEGAFIYGSELTGANLEGATYDEKTQLPNNLRPELVKMVSKVPIPPPLAPITVKDLLRSLNSITACGDHYLGITLTLKYLKSSRPEPEWINKFDITELPIQFVGSPGETVSTIQLKWFEQWMKNYIKSCSLIIQDFPRIVETKQVELNLLKLW